eukprot:TRINITY_DN3789_c0_g1_i2.p1 TRINITY_DN3789_c0_g1~~TRINITY_DN3789_c0_g1_i2.p1  ORF type:complete len:632 (-),score=80.71 TRINITY_DN3789_c0_g1_i2:19-1914(-)
MFKCSKMSTKVATTQNNITQLTKCEISSIELANGTYPNEEAMLIFSGKGINELGMYDECQSLDNAHYCILTYSSQSISGRTGLCLPAACNDSDLQPTVDVLAAKILGNKVTSVTINCASKTIAKPDTAAIVMFSFIGFVCLLALLGGAIEYYITQVIFNFGNAYELALLLPQGQTAPKDHTTEKHSLFVRILLCFSPITNFQKLLYPSPSAQLASLNGLRTLSLTWVILGHTIFWALSVGYQNPAHVGVELTRWYTTMITSAPYSVDSFFYMSGFLVAYFAQKELQKKNKLPIVLYYVHRFWRLTPPYMVALLIFWLCTPYFGSGPFWYETATYKTRVACDKYWWTNLLYINNFYPTTFSGECMGWTWYLANDTQLYALTPIFVYAYWWRRWVGWLAVFLATMASLASNFTIDFENNYSPDFFSDGNQSTTTYSKFYTRAAPWMVGIAAAWVLMWHEKRKDQRLSWPIVAACFTLSGILLGSTVFGTESLYAHNGVGWNRAQNLLYLTFGRFAFSVGLAIMMHLCYTGNGLFINSFLSMRIFDVTARLSYSAYLYHPIIMGVVYMGGNQLFYYSAVNITVHYFGFTVLSLLAACLSYLLIERPMMGLEKFLHPAPKRPPPPREVQINSPSE